MTYRPGPLPVLTRDQVKTILAWNKRRSDFYATYGSVAKLASNLGIPLRLTYKYLEICEGELSDHQRSPQRRPRRVSKRKLSFLAAWVDARSYFLGAQTTVSDLAASLNVKPDRVWDCIRRKGRYPGLMKSVPSQEQPKLAEVPPFGLVPRLGRDRKSVV